MNLLCFYICSNLKKELESNPALNPSFISKMEEAKRKLVTFPNRPKLIDTSSRDSKQLLTKSNWNLSRAILLTPSPLHPESFEIPPSSSILIPLVAKLAENTPEELLPKARRLCSLLINVTIENINEIKSLFEELSLSESAQVCDHFYPADPDRFYRDLIDPPPVLEVVESAAPSKPRVLITDIEQAKSLVEGIEYKTENNSLTSSGFTLSLPSSASEIELFCKLVQSIDPEEEELFAQYRLSILDKLKEILHQIDQGSMSELQMRVHKLAGSAGTYGYTVVSPFMKEWEKALRENSITPDQCMDRYEKLIQLFIDSLTQPTSTEEVIEHHVEDTISLFVVDDDQYLRELICTKGVEKGFQVESFASFLEAQKRLKDPNFYARFLLFDQMCTNEPIKGTDLIATYHREHPTNPHTYVGLATTEHGIENRILGFKEGIDVFFSKPMDVDQLLYQIERYCKAELNRKLKILVLDDDTEFCAMIENTLKNSGHRFLSLNSPDTLFNMLENELPDLLLLDINFPEYNGVELLQAIHNDYRFKNLNIIIISANSYEETFQNRFVPDIQDYWTKPLDPIKLANELNSTIKRILLSLLPEERDPILGIFNRTMLEHFYASLCQKYRHIHVVYTECPNSDQTNFMKFGQIFNRYFSTKEFVGYWDRNQLVILVVDYRLAQLKALLETIIEGVQAEPDLQIPTALFSIVTYPYEGSNLEELVAKAKSMENDPWSIASSDVEIETPQDREIFLIGSNTPLIETIDYSLNLRNYPTRTFDQGLVGFQFIKDHFLESLPGLIILDSDLDDENPTVILHKMKFFVGERVPIFYLSNLTKEEDIHEGLELGVQDYIAKPFTMELLIQRIDQEMQR